MERIKFDKEANKDRQQRFSLMVDPPTADLLRVKGYFTIWDTLNSDKRNGYYVSFAKGSLRLPDYDIVLYFNHDDSQILARESNGSLEIGEDERGGYMSANLVDCQYERDLIKRMDAGLIRQMSVGVYPIVTHKEERVVTAADAASNPDLIAEIGKTIKVEVYDTAVLDEVTITPRGSFPQTSVQSYQKENEEWRHNYEWHVDVVAMREPD